MWRKRSEAITRCALSLAAGLLALTHPASEARASAWNAPAGDGLLIADYSLETGGHYFNGKGALSRTAAYTRQDAYGYVEYGVTDWLMAVVKPELTAISAGSDTGRASHYTGLGTGEAAAQLRLLAYGPAVLAVSGGFRLPGSTDESVPALIGNTSFDEDLRVLGGTSFSIGPFPAFLDVQAAYRFRSGAVPDEWHGDVTVGFRPLSRLLLYAQSFTTVSAGSGLPTFPDYVYSKVGLTAVYDVSARWSVELGVFGTVYGVNALRERGIKTGVWYRF